MNKTTATTPLVDATAATHGPQLPTMDKRIKRGRAKKKFPDRKSTGCEDNGKKPDILRWSLMRAAKEFDRNINALRRDLTRANITPNLFDGRYSTGDITRALFGDMYKARLRRIEAEATTAEEEAKLAKQQSMPVADVHKFVGNTLSTVREQVLSLPGIAARCNPEDPERARSELTLWADSFIEKCRAAVPTTPPTTKETNEKVRLPSPAK